MSMWHKGLDYMTPKTLSTLKAIEKHRDRARKDES